MFERAEKLGMPVGEMMDRMTSAELMEWMALDAVRADERAKAARMAKQRASKRR